MSGRNRNLCIACLICLSLAGARVSAEELDYRWSAGLSYPGLGLRYFLLPDTALEVKVQGEENIFLAGARFYQYWGRFGRVRLFAGAEADLVSATGEVSTGQGWAGEILAGGEFFFWPPFSFQADLGPAWVFLRDKATGIQAGGSPEWVVNLGINWHFGKE